MFSMIELNKKPLRWGRLNIFVRNLMYPSCYLGAGTGETITKFKTLKLIYISVH